MIDPSQIIKSCDSSEFKDSYYGEERNDSLKEAKRNKSATNCYVEVVIHHLGPILKHLCCNQVQVMARIGARSDELRKIH